MISLRKYLKKNDCISLIFAISIFLSCRPYFTWQWNTMSTIIISLIIALISFSHLNIKNCTLRVSFSFLLIAYFILSLLRGAGFGIIIYLSLAILPFIQTSFFIKSYERFKWILCVFFILSLLSLVTVMIGIQTTPRSIEALNDVKTYSYFQYYFLVIPNYLSDDFSRFCSVFDEPGVVGTISALILTAEKFNFNDKKNIIIFIAGFLSFSLYFFLIIFIYFILNSQTKHKLLFILCLAVFYIFTSDNPFIQDKIWNRLLLTNKGTIAGDNRNSEEFIKIWDQHKYSFELLWGYGNSLVKNYQNSASIQLFIMRDGLVFVLMYFISFILIIGHYINNNKTRLFLLSIIFLTLYQRPGFCEPSFTILFVAIILKYSNYVNISHSNKL